jgi:hypothetical protein
VKRLLKYVASAATLLSPFAAHSADLAVRAPPPPVFSRTGFYIGPNIGGAWANNTGFRTPAARIRPAAFHAAGWQSI